MIVFQKSRFRIVDFHPPRWRFRIIPRTWCSNKPRAAVESLASENGMGNTDLLLLIAIVCIGIYKCRCAHRKHRNAMQLAERDIKSGRNVRVRADGTYESSLPQPRTVADL